MQVTGQTKIVGVMGWPIEHSLSPQMHNAAFEALDMNCCYVPLPVDPALLPQAVEGLRALDFVGCNVTVPHKQGVWACLDEVSENAQAVGAVNTLIRRGDEWYGDNSDIPGFLMSLQEENFDPDGKQAVILGAGGAARGVVYALLQAGASVAILNRTLSRAEALADELRQWVPEATLETRPLDTNELAKEAAEADLLVNATTLGMWPKTGVSPWPKELTFPSHLTVFDLVYNPLETRFLAQAKAAGATTIGGLKMLVYQGAVSFNWWFGRMPPTDIMYDVCRVELERR